MVDSGGAIKLLRQLYRSACKKACVLVLFSYEHPRPCPQTQEALALSGAASMHWQEAAAAFLNMLNA
ncbi:MAG: hypothetical protein LBU32_05710 [Clostridiales bacterium]|jgi:hypothetical protein|nr:hypothetical protein [Clostridiales bacterium]